MVELRMVRPGGRLSEVSDVKSRSLWIGLLILITMPELGGCARSLRNIDTARDAFAIGDLARASETLRDVAVDRSRFADAASLDLAMVELAGGMRKRPKSDCGNSVTVSTIFPKSLRFARPQQLPPTTRQGCFDRPATKR